MSVKVSGQFKLTIEDVAANLPPSVTQRNIKAVMAQSIDYSSAVRLDEKFGVYTANNDLVTILSADSSYHVDMLVILTDNPVGLSVTQSGGSYGYFSGLVIDGLFVVKLKNRTAGKLTSVQFDSRSAITTSPIAVGTEIKYYVAFIYTDNT